MKQSLKATSLSLLTVTAMMATVQMTKAVNYCAGNLSGQSEAALKCPQICAGHGGWDHSWNSQYTTDPRGRTDCKQPSVPYYHGQSVCGCKN